VVEIRIPHPTTNPTARRLERFVQMCQQANVSDKYIIAHARLALDALNASDRRKFEPAPKIVPPLPPVSKSAADQLYVDTANQLLAGLQKLIDIVARSEAPEQKHIAFLWQQSAGSP
jgi:hypothetical protein